MSAKAGRYIVCSQRRLRGQFAFLIENAGAGLNMTTRAYGSLTDQFASARYVETLAKVRSGSSDCRFSGVPL